MSIQRKRAYDTITAEDGYRVLTERLWPRGLSKAQLKIDEWLKELAPSPELRLWFKHDPTRWQEFQIRYREELSTPEKQQELARLIGLARTKPLTLVYASRDEAGNSTQVLEAMLKELSQKQHG